MKEKIFEFLAARQTEAPRSPIGLEANLFDEGILDSFGLVEFVKFLEVETGFHISDDDINDDRFTSVGGILEILAAKNGSTGRAELGGGQ